MIVTEKKFALLNSFPKEEFKKLQKRIVYDVEEFIDEESPSGRFNMWKGSTKDEYFTVVLMRGILTISIEERECHMMKERVHCIGSITTFLEKMASFKVASKQQEFLKNYFMKGQLDDLYSTNISHVMDFLKWKFVNKKVKIKEGILFD